MKVMLLNDDCSTVPTRGSEHAAGYDLYASENGFIGPRGGRGAVPTGIAIAVPPGTYGRVAPRSGLALRHGIDVLAGVIDADYRGEVKVILINHGVESFYYRIGDRIAQLIIYPILTNKLEIVNELPGSERGIDGFGSTGR